MFNRAAPHLTSLIMISDWTSPMYVRRLWSSPVDSVRCTARLLFVNKEDIIVDIEDFPMPEPGLWAHTTFTMDYIKIGLCSGMFVQTHY